MSHTLAIEEDDIKFEEDVVPLKEDYHVGVDDHGIRPLLIFALCCLTMVGNTFCSYVSFSSVGFKDHFGVSSGQVGLLMTVPLVGSMFGCLVAPNVIRLMGLSISFICVSCIECLLFVVVLVCFNYKSFFGMVAAQSGVNLCISVLILGGNVAMSSSMTPEAFAKIAPLPFVTFNGLGGLIASFALVKLELAQRLTILLGLGIFNIAVCCYLAYSSSRTTETKDDETTDAEETNDIHTSTWWGFPWKFWLVIGVNVCNLGFQGWTESAPNALHDIYGLTQQSANMYPSIVLLTVTLAGPVAGYVYGTYASCTGPLLLVAAVLALVRTLATALTADKYLLLPAWIMLGISQVMVRAGGASLVPVTLKGTNGIAPSAFRIKLLTGFVAIVISSQLTFSTATYSVKVGIFDVIPGELYLVLLAVALLALAITIWHVQPLEPDVMEASTSSDGEDDTN